MKDVDRREKETKRHRGEEQEAEKKNVYFT